jgi:hypothetical protein
MVKYGFQCTAILPVNVHVSVEIESDVSELCSMEIEPDVGDTNLQNQLRLHLLH